jgi:hypothetical protein
MGVVVELMIVMSCMMGLEVSRRLMAVVVVLMVGLCTKVDGIGDSVMMRNLMMTNGGFGDGVGMGQ